MSGARSWASYVLDGGGAVVRKPGTTTLIKASLDSLALITCLGLWKCLEIGLKPRIMCTARS